MKQEGKKAMKGASMSWLLSWTTEASLPWGLPKEPHRMRLRMTPPEPGKPRHLSIDSLLHLPHPHPTHTGWGLLPNCNCLQAEWHSKAFGTTWKVGMQSHCTMHLWGGADRVHQMQVSWLSVAQAHNEKMSPALLVGMRTKWIDMDVLKMIIGTLQKT